MQKPISMLIPLLLTCASPVLAQFKKPEAGGIRLDKQLAQHWQVGVKIRAIGGPCAGLMGTVPVPADWPEQEMRVVEEDVSDAVRRVSYRTLGGVRQMLFSIPRLDANEEANVLITFEINKSSVLAPEDTSQYIIPKNAPRDVRKHLAASPMIESRNSEIRQKAKEIIEGKEGAWQQVEAIFDWVRDNVKYRNGNMKGAVAAMRAGSACKEDLASLFIALCRSVKIPARTVFVPDHCYPEFYLQDKKGKGTWFPCQVAGTRDFGAMPDHRPILQKGDNFKVPEKREPQRFVAEFLTGKAGRGFGTPQVQFVRKLLPKK